ncbi:MAG: HAMP domain-containing sensor histidine kinase [Bacteroidota bacterium]
MKQERSTLLLMLSSMVVLTSFLAFWLREGYLEAETAMTEKGNLLYQESVRQVQDSVYHQFIKVFVQRAEQGSTFETDSFPSALTRFNLDLRTDQEVDSTAKPTFPGEGTNRYRQLNLTVSADTVADKDTLVFIERFEHLENIDLSVRDTSLQAEIRQYFDQKLVDNQLPSSYTVALNPAKQDTSDLRFFPGDFNTFRSEEVIFTETGSFLLGKISGQLLFSLFLLGLTGLAFWSLRRSTQQALQYTQLKSDFMSNMTHELKTPITTIGLALEAIQGFVTQNEQEKTEEYLQISQHELSRLSLLVDKVLKLTLFEESIPQLKMAPTDLQHISQKVVDAMKLQIEESGGVIEFECSGASFELSADAVHLSNVLFNLLDNSLKYTTGAPEIRLALEDQEDFVYVTVSDRGIGIPIAYEKKVFDRFFRVPSTGNRHDVKGYGLGLSYVADIVKQHGGQIQLRSNEPQGSIFQIILPKAHE